LLLIVVCIVVVTGSCRLVVRFVQMRHVYEVLEEETGEIWGGETDVISYTRELFLCFTCISTTLVIFNY